MQRLTDNQLTRICFRIHTGHTVHFHRCRYHIRRDGRGFFWFGADGYLENGLQTCIRDQEIADNDVAIILHDDLVEDLKKIHKQYMETWPAAH